MSSVRCLWLAGAMFSCLLTGCAFVPKSRLTASETHARALSEQNQALLADLENRKVHYQHMEDRLRRAEEDLALVEEQLSSAKRQKDGTSVR
jgi:hypothetical protein